MLTLSSTLLAAQRQTTPPPASVRLVVRDLWNRWQSFFNEGEANPNHSAACWYASGSTVARVRVDASGNLQTQVVSNLNSESAWETWTTRQTSIYVGDVAISDNDGTLRCFYLRREGASSPYTWRVKTIESTNGGSTWGSESEVETASHANPYGGLASPGYDAIVLQRPDGTVRLRILSGGSWGAPDDWTASPSAGFGIATTGDPFANLWVLVAGTFDGVNRVQLASYSIGEGWKSGGDIAPVGTSQANFVARWPTLAYKSDTYQFLLGWIEDVNAGGLDSATLVLIPAYDQITETSARVSPNIAVDQTNPRRANLVYDPDGERWFLCGEVGIHVATAYGASVASKNLTLDGVARVHLTDGRDSASLELDLYDPTRALVGWGTGSESKNALRPLAMLTIERGYLTASGEERAPTSPLFLLMSGYRRNSGEERFRLVAADGWHLLDLWRAPHAYQWTNISIGLLADRLVHLVGPWGLSRDGTNGNWQTVLASFSIPPEESLRSALLRLLSLAGARLLWHPLSGYPYGQWVAPIWNDTPGSSVYDYEYSSENPDRHPYYHDFIATGAPTDTQVRAFGADAATNVSNAAGSETLGRDVYTFVTTRHLDTSTELAGLAGGIKQAGQAEAEDGYIVAHPNVGLETGDVISIYDSALGYSPVLRRVYALMESYDTEQGIYEQRIRLEAL